MQTEQGIGLIEVMVALLVLAIGVLGYSAMQTRSIASSDDALLRTKAIGIVTELTERMRNNAIDPTTLSAYATAVNGASLPAQSDCTSGCAATATANNDVRELGLQAQDLGISLGMDNCPGNASGYTRQCIIAAWGDTAAEFNSNDTSCMTASGTYVAGSQCIVMEAY